MKILLRLTMLATFIFAVGFVLVKIFSDEFEEYDNKQIVQTTSEQTYEHLNNDISKKEVQIKLLISEPNVKRSTIAKQDLTKSSKKQYESSKNTSVT